MSNKKESKESVVVIKEEEYIEIKRMLNLMHDYITDKLERYRQREDERLVDIYDMHQFLGMSERTIYRRVEDGLLRCHRLDDDDDGKMVFTIRDIKNAVASKVLKTTTKQLYNLIDNHRIYDRFKRPDSK